MYYIYSHMNVGFISGIHIEYVHIYLWQWYSKLSTLNNFMDF